MGLLRAPAATVPARNEDARQHNLRAVLQAISSAGELSRADVARLTGLTRPTVSSLVAELLDQDLVVELGVGASVGGGRPPTLVGVNPQGRDILALDLSRQPFRGARVDLSGQIRDLVEGEGRNLQGDAAVEEVRAIIRRLVDASAAPVAGVGVGTPGLVTSEGVVVEAANLGWHDLPLAERLGDLGFPVWIANDADVAALAEVSSLPPDHDSVVVIKVATGIGAGVVIDGKPVVGARAATGEIGHLVVVDGGPPCSCGNAGCLETVASVPSILRLGALAAGVDPARLDGVPWTAAAVSEIVGEEALAAAVDEAGRHLGRVVAHIVALLDVAHLTIACELEGVEDWLVAAVDEVLDSHLLHAGGGPTHVGVSDHGSSLVLAGASALVASRALGLVWR